MVRSDLKRQGIGSRLMRKAVEHCRSRGTREVAGDVLAGNESMLSLAKAHGGFRIEETDEPGIVRIRLDLRAGAV